MIIKNLKLQNWKNFQSCDIELTERCFIIGSNASGKSNLIDALRFLRDVAKQGGGLQSAVEERGGITKIRSLSARTKTNVSITIALGEPDEDFAEWEYHLEFVHTGGGILKSQVKILKERVFSHSQNKMLVNRGESKDDEDEETLKYTHLEQATANREFRDIQFFFQNIEYLNVVPQLVRESASLIQSSSKEDYYGRNFLEKLSKMNERTRSAYFRRINQIIKIAVPQLEELNFVKDQMGVPHLEAKYVHWRAKGGKQQEAQFSDGTLRLIGLLFALIDSNGVLLLEEPEINLHSAIITQLPEFIAKIQRTKKSTNQVLITTHSFEILSNEGISPDEVILLENEVGGTKVSRVSDIENLRHILSAGLTIADAVIPFTKPKNIDQLTQLKMDF